jgi:UDP-glucose 4-epimerase
LYANGRDKPELAGARPSIDINIDGTLNVLSWAQTLPALECLVNVSSGSVYAETGPERIPLPEDGYVAPEGLYAITKYTGELFTSFSAREFGLPAVSVRLSGVFGPMDRITPTRDVICAPKAIAQRALAGEVVRTSSLDGVGDFIQAGDVATAIIALLRATNRQRDVYNVASGETASIEDLLEYTREKIPKLDYTLTGAGDFDVDYDPARRTGRWGAYDISRVHGDTGWSPRPLRESLHEYIDWLQMTGSTSRLT